MQESHSSPAVEEPDEEDEAEISSQKSRDEDETPTFLTTRRQNSVPGGRSLAQTGHEATIIQGSPFIYCGAPPMQHTPINSHRRLMHHNSMRTPTSYERNNNSNNMNENNSLSNNNMTNNNTRSLSGSRRLKRHDTDPSMRKNGKSKLSSPSTAPAMECYQDGYLNVPLMSRDRASPSVGSVQSDPESCLDGSYFYDDDDDSLISRFILFIYNKKMVK